MTTNPDRLGSSPFSKTYAESGALGADVDLKAAGGGPCRFIYVGATGDVAIKNARDASTAIFHAVPVGTVLRVQATAIVAATTSAQKLTVGW